MDFGLTEPQALLRDSIARFLDQAVGIDRVRSVMDSESGRDETIHGELGDLGIAGLLIHLEQGGTGLGMQEAAIAAQELGRAAAPVNFHSSYILAPLLLAGAPESERRNQLLEGIAAGSTLVVPILNAPIAEGRVDGSVLYVPDGCWADAFLLESEGSLHLVDRGAGGVEAEPLMTVDDTRRVAEVTFAAVGPEALEELGGSAEGTRRAVHAARVALAADALGAAQQGLQIAVEYARERKQFDRIIGSFQAVKHMCAEALAEIEPVQSLLWHTADAWDEESDAVDYLAPLLKAHATDMASQAVTTSTQVFGGIGFTHECDMHIFYKRVGYDRQMLGNPTALREQAAAARFA